MGKGGRGGRSSARSGHGGKGSPHANRSNSTNPNNPAQWASEANRAHQLGLNDGDDYDDEISVKKKEDYTPPFLPGAQLTEEYFLDRRKFVVYLRSPEGGRVKIQWSAKNNGYVFFRECRDYSWSMELPPFVLGDDLRVIEYRLKALGYEVIGHDIIT